VVVSRVVDPYSFFPDPDPDPEFEAGYNTDPDPDPIRIQGFNDQKLKKITAENFFYFFLIKNCNLPIPRPP
jgi:hypothetical protein